MKITHCILSLGLIIGSFILYSCDGMNSLHQEYIDSGEKIYAARIDSSVIRSGYKRQQLDLFFLAQRIERGKITWNFKEDSVEVEFPAPGKEPFSVSLPDMQEGDYTYELITYDKYGNTSIPMELIGKVYGDNYREGLVNKRIESMHLLSDDNEVATMLKWRRSENSVGVNLSYTNNQGDKVTLFVPETEEETILTDNIPGTDFSFSTLFWPDTTCVDTIPAIETIRQFPKALVLSKEDWENNFHPNYTDLDGNGWTIEANTEELVGEGDVNGRATALLDGDIYTFWHSQWLDASPSLPHRLEIDMQKEQLITSIELARRYDNNNTKKVILYISSDKVDWNEICILDYPDYSSVNSKIALFPGTVKGRYLRLMVTESHNSYHTSLSAIMLTTIK